eukprot:Polyplicarium_translucidae@DN5206_c0_g1_i1.p1
MSIKKLPEHVINKIAAGEVIIRPANALKELLENSLDAGSTKIDVTVKQGGVKTLQISDDGSGIQVEDLPIACERFTTSKIQTYEDVQHVSTFGFRGEALASLSHVSHVTIQTRTADSQMGTKCLYQDGKPVGPAAPCARMYGTTIIAEDLFYNMPARLRGISSSGDEYVRILDVLQKYAIQNPRVSISCKKFGSSSVDIRTYGSKHAVDAELEASREVIRCLYGAAVSRELIDFVFETESMGCKALVSTPNFSVRRGSLI